MDIKYVNRETEAEFLLIGRLDAQSAPELEEIILQAIEKFNKVILNFDSLIYISSAGLRVMQKSHVEMEKKDGELVIKNVNGMVKDVFELTGFASFLNIE